MGESLVQTWEQVEARLRTILPETYEESYESVAPVSMGSAGLKFDGAGKVAWDEIWGSFCDLAMAGGPPHRGRLLEAGREEEITAEAERYNEVVGEICRGITMVTGLHAEPAPMAGWVRMYCTSAAMASWMGRAIVMENVSADAGGLSLYLPAGPGYRVEKEIKNVVTSVAKTFHYWTEHMSDERRQAIADVFRLADREQPLLRPAMVEGVEGTDGRGEMAALLEAATGLRARVAAARGWVEVECGEVGAAVWMMRVLVASQMLARREGTVVCIPFASTSDAAGGATVEIFRRVYGFAVERGVLAPVAGVRG